MPPMVTLVRSLSRMLLMLLALETVALAQPGKAALAVPPTKRPQAPPESKQGIDRSGGYLDQRIGFGTFNILNRTEDREDVHRFAVGFGNELGVHLGPFVSVFLDTSVVFHHYETAGDLAEWVYDDIGKWGILDFFRVTFGTILIPAAMFVDSQTNLSIGMRVHPVASSRSPYLEVGGGISLLLDRPDSEYGGIGGALFGAGYQFSHRRSLGVRALFSPLFADSIKRFDGSGVSVLVVFQLR